MNEQTKAKAAATRAANKASYANQTIDIGEGWRVVRADELNWEVQFNGKFYGYHGKLCNALKALADKMVGEGVKNTLADVQARQNAIHSMIENAVKR